VVVDYFNFTNLKNLFFCITIFAALSNHSYLLAENACAAIASAPKKMGDDEFKVLVENIYDLLQHENSVDDIVEMLEDDQTIPYNIKKLVTHIHSLLDKQNSKCNIVSIVVNNNKSKEYSTRTNFLSLLKNATSYYFALKVIAIILAFVVACYFLLQYISGEFGVLKGKPKPKNQCDAKDINEKSNDHELPNPNVSDHDDTHQPVERQEDRGHKIPVPATQEIPSEAHQTDQYDSTQAAQETNQDGILVSDKADTVMVERPQVPAVIFVENISVDYALMERVQKLAVSAKSLCSGFVEPSYIDESLRATGISVSEEPRDTRKLSEIIDERIGQCKRLLENEYLKTK
jgi:hypothetical protein